MQRYLSYTLGSVLSPSRLVSFRLVLLTVRTDFRRGLSLLTDHVTVSVQGQDALARVRRGRNARHMPARDSLAGAARSAGCAWIRVALLHGILVWSRHRRQSLE